MLQPDTVVAGQAYAGQRCVLRGDLGDIKIPEPALKRLNDKIQMVVLDELAGIDMPGDIGVRFPREWLGIWLRLVKPNDPVSKEFDELGKKMGDIMR